MATPTATPSAREPVAERWYALDPEELLRRLGVAPEMGLTAAEAAARLKQNGANVLPTEKPPSACAASSPSTRPTCS